jgi:hypothetical protein
MTMEETPVNVYTAPVTEVTGSLAKLFALKLSVVNWYATQLREADMIPHGKSAPGRKAVLELNSVVTLLLTLLTNASGRKAPALASKLAAMENNHTSAETAADDDNGETDEFKVTGRALNQAFEAVDLDCELTGKLGADLLALLRLYLETNQSWVLPQVEVFMSPEGPEAAILTVFGPGGGPFSAIYTLAYGRLENLASGVVRKAVFPQQAYPELMALMTKKEAKH